MCLSLNRSFANAEKQRKVISYRAEGKNKSSGAFYLFYLVPFIDKIYLLSA